MPRYAVLKQGFLNGLLYDPNGKRRIVYTKKAFPKKQNKEQVPSWLSRMEDEVEPERLERETAEQEAARLEQERISADSREVQAFLTPDVGPTGASVVETL